jgi:hypothetical protein
VSKYAIYSRILPLIQNPEQRVCTKPQCCPNGRTISSEELIDLQEWTDAPILASLLDAYLAHAKEIQQSNWCIYPSEFGDVLSMVAEKCGGKFDRLTSADMDKIQECLVRYRVERPFKGGPDPQYCKGVIIPWYQMSNEWITGEHWLVITVKWPAQFLSTMTPRREWVHDLKPWHVPIRLSDHSVVFSEGVGSVWFEPLLDGLPGPAVQLTCVLYMPSLGSVRVVFLRPFPFTFHPLLCLFCSAWPP